MARYTQVDITSIAGVNAELSKIETAINEMLDRDGTAPNTMEADFDMNSNDILNANAINGQSLDVTTLTVNNTDISGGGSVDVTANYAWTGTHTIGGYTVLTTNNLLEQSITITEDTTTSYTAVLADRNGLVTMDNAASNSFIVPPNSDVAYPTGTTLSVCQIGAGQTTVTQGVGVTINSEIGYKIKGQYGFATLIKTGTDTWLLSGSLEA